MLPPVPQGTGQPRRQERPAPQVSSPEVEAWSAPCLRAVAADQGVTPGSSPCGSEILESRGRPGPAVVMTLKTSLTVVDLAFVTKRCSRHFDLSFTLCGLCPQARPLLLFIFVQVVKVGVPLAHSVRRPPWPGAEGCVLPALIPFCPQDESTGEITFYMKGADVVMAGIVQYNDWLEEEVSAELATWASGAGARRPRPVLAGCGCVTVLPET